MIRRRRARPHASVALLIVLSALAACDREADASAAGDARAVSIAADHHVHILSPELVRDWQSLGVPFSRPDSAYTSVTAIFAAHTVQAFLVSMAHIYGSDDFRRGLDLSLDAEHHRVQQANDHVAHEVARAPASFVGFCSVHLLRPYAAHEIERCRDPLRLAGLKLHLPASGIDLTDPSHLQLLAAVAADAARAGSPLLVHLAPVDGELTTAELRAFLQHVVEPNPGLEIYLAHLGGNGGYRTSAQRAVHAVTGWLDATDGKPRAHIYLELSGALLARRTDGVPASGRADGHRLAADLRRLGLEHVVFGSDYPVFDAAAYAGFLEARLPLAPDELARIMNNRAPAFTRAPAAE